MRSPRWPYRRAHPLRRLPSIGLLIAAALWLLLPGVASAHAHLTQADPAPNGVIVRAPAVASFVFDEPVNPAMTHVRIIDAAGHQVAAGGYLAGGHSGELWRLALPRLAVGIYSVLWTSESATDGHVMSSFYTFRVARAGGAARMDAVMGTAAGAMGGMAADGSDTLLSISTGAGTTAFFAWLGQMAQALWLGALVIELIVLAPARRTAETPEARLARAATPRLWALGQGALVAMVASIGGETVSLAVQGTGGDWGQALAPATLVGILSSQNGQIVVARLVVLVVALLIARKVRVPFFASSSWMDQPVRYAPQAVGIVAPRLVTPRWESARGSLVCLACVYMLLVALSGHAANVAPLWLSAGIDWLHLVCTAAWIGGIAALAYGVLPQRRTLLPKERAPALLPLLDRFSPVAYLAVGTLTLSGFYNAVSHIDQPSMVADTTYGHLLVVKMGLVGLLIALSASHVRGLRPLIARAQKTMGPASQGGTGALATVHEGLATLAGRLRLEAGIGAAVLLVTAAMGQTLPATTVHATMTDPAHTAMTDMTPPAPASITGTVARGDLRGRLTIAPPTVGTVMVTLKLWEQGRPVTSDTGAAIIHLYPAAQPAMRATLTPGARGVRFLAQGSLAATGTWRADVLVRTATVNEYRMLPFTFTAGPGARFLAPARSQK